MNNTDELEKLKTKLNTWTGTIQGDAELVKPALREFISKLPEDKALKIESTDDVHIPRIVEIKDGDRPRGVWMNGDKVV